MKAEEDIDAIKKEYRSLLNIKTVEI